MTPKDLKKLRIMLGLSQQKFGVLLGFSPKTSRSLICAYEKGREKISPRIEGAVRLSNAVYAKLKKNTR